MSDGDVATSPLLLEDLNHLAPSLLFSLCVPEYRRSNERLIREDEIAYAIGDITMSDDPHIELLKRRKLQLLKRRLLIEKVEAEKQEEATDAASTPAPPPPPPTEVLRRVFIGRAWEVWNAAMAQYPQITKELEEALVKLIQSGRLRNQITGEQLFWFFRRLGVRVRLNTKIRIYESGELKSIADKLRD